MTLESEPVNPAPVADLALETILMHVGQAPDPTTGAVVTPIHPSVTYVYPAVDQQPPFVYSRLGNPTRAVLEQLLAALEQGQQAVAFSSGMAAVTATALLLSAGDHAVVARDCYVGTFQLFARHVPRFGIAVDFVDLTDLGALERAIRPTTRLVLLETPSNPRLQIVDIAAVAARAHASGALVAVDNTFASPYCQRPLALGADLVIHSTTKYLGGHSDVLGGAVITRSAGLAERLADHQHVMGAVPSPFDCWLLIRGIKTLAVRMRQHLANAQAIAEWLHEHPKVARVHYPGLPSHPGHALAKRQMPGGFGGMLSFELKGGFNAAKTVVEHTKLFRFAVSLGGVESLIYAPGAVASADPVQAQQTAGSVWAQNAGLVRVSVGLERAEDLIADLDQALAHVR